MVQRTIPLSAGFPLILVDIYLIAKIVPSVKIVILHAKTPSFLPVFGQNDTESKKTGIFCIKLTQILLFIKFF
jgi:hypothetical protein